MTTEPERTFSLVKGISMLPVLHTGDRVELLPVARSAVRVGDILAFSAADGREIIHRVKRLEPLQTRGDNCVNDDAPVPEGSALYQAVACHRDGKRTALTGGAAGMREFRRNQRLCRMRRTAKRLLAPLAMLNPFRTPFEKLRKCVFGEQTVYYAGKHPVGWTDAEGWHWMHLGRYRVKRLPDGLLQEKSDIPRVAERVGIGNRKW